MYVYIECFLPAIARSIDLRDLGLKSSVATQAFSKVEGWLLLMLETPYCSACIRHASLQRTRHEVRPHLSQLLESALRQIPRGGLLALPAMCLPSFHSLVLTHVPSMISTSDSPPSCPPNQHWTNPLLWSLHGIRTTLPVDVEDGTIWLSFTHCLDKVILLPR